MAIKSIIDLELNDAAFQNFAAVFAKYQAALAATPAAWRGVDTGISAGTASLNDMVAAQATAILMADRIKKAQEDSARATRSSAQVWRDMARDTKEVFSNIFGATKQLLSWASLTAVFTGVLGAGGLFGINRLAEGVASDRKQAMGTGTTIGEEKAFSTNFSRLVDPKSFLSGVNRALTDPESRVTLYGAGLKDRDLKGSTGDVGLKVLEGLKALADRTPKELLGSIHRAYKVDGVMTAEDFQRLKSTDIGELRDQFRKYAKDRSENTVSDPTAKKYQDFVDRIDHAGNMIRTTFVNGLEPIIPGLEKLSVGVQQAVKTLLGSEALKDGIENFGKGLVRFANYLTTDDFQQNVSTFVKGVGDLSQAVVKALRFLHIIDGEKTEPEKSLDERAKTGDYTAEEKNVGGDAPKSYGESKFNKFMNRAMPWFQGHYDQKTSQFTPEQPEKLVTGAPQAYVTVPVSKPDPQKPRLDVVAGQPPQRQRGPAEPYVILKTVPAQQAPTSALDVAGGAAPGRDAPPVVVNNAPPLVPDQKPQPARTELPVKSFARGDVGDQTGPAPLQVEALLRGMQNQRDGVVPEGLRVKPGSGYVDPGLGELALIMQGAVTGFKEATSFNDKTHDGTGSKHSENQAFDFTIKDGSFEAYAKAAQQARDELKRLNIGGTVIDEKNFPSSRATAPHLHVQPDRPVRVEMHVSNAAGSDVNVITRQVAS